MMRAAVPVRETAVFLIVAKVAIHRAGVPRMSIVGKYVSSELRLEKPGSAIDAYQGKSKVVQ